MLICLCFVILWERSRGKRSEKKKIIVLMNEQLSSPLFRFSFLLECHLKASEGAEESLHISVCNLAPYIMGYSGC